MKTLVACLVAVMFLAVGVAAHADFDAWGVAKVEGGAIGGTAYFTVAPQYHHHHQTMSSTPVTVAGSYTDQKAFAGSASGMNGGTMTNASLTTGTFGKETVLSGNSAGSFGVQTSGYWSVGTTSVKTLTFGATP